MKEAGEVCDCLTEYECTLRGEFECCDPKTCQLRTNKQCMDGGCCEKCMFKSKGGRPNSIKIAKLNEDSAYKNRQTPHSEHNSLLKLKNFSEMPNSEFKTTHTPHADF